MKNQISIIFFLSVVLLGLSGCATRYPVRVDALSSGSMDVPVRGSTFILVSETPGVEESELFFKEVSRHLVPVLKDRGMRPAVDRNSADIVIAVDAHLSDPLVKTESYSEPIYMETRGHMRSLRVPVLNQEGEVIRYAHSAYWVPSRTYNAGWVDRDRQFTVYDKILRLSARKVLGNGSYSDEIWAITVSLRSESTDYRSALPYMLVAAKPYIGGRTDGEEVIMIQEDSEDLQAFKAGL